jgi:hypothetical protein
MKTALGLNVSLEHPSRACYRRSGFKFSCYKFSLFLKNEFSSLYENLKAVAMYLICCDPLACCPVDSNVNQFKARESGFAFITFEHSKVSKVVPVLN